MLMEAAQVKQYRLMEAAQLVLLPAGQYENKTEPLPAWIQFDSSR